MGQNKNTLRVKVIKALANTNRLAIVECLSAEHEVCVSDIVPVVGLDQSTVSKHLSILKDAGIVVARKEGLQMFYRLRTQCVLNFMQCVDRLVAEDIESKQQFFESR